MKNTKFRAWDEQFKIMRYDYKIGFHPEQKIEYGLIGNFEPFIGRWKSEKEFVYFPLMQYTGLLDKNGKEICGWDVVKGTHNKSKIGIYKVYFNENVLAWYILGEQGDIHLCDLEDCEVIGNIYENENLISKN